MQSKASTVKEYLNSLPEERRKEMETVRKVIKKNLPKGYREVMAGMIAYVVPLSTYPAGYLGDPTQPLAYIGLASQKNNISLYLMNIYGDQKIQKWFLAEYKKTGKRMDMGKSCIRFKKAEQLPLELIGKTVAATPVEEFISWYANARSLRKRRK